MGFMIRLRFYLKHFLKNKIFYALPEWMFFFMYALSYGIFAFPFFSMENSCGPCIFA